MQDNLRIMDWLHEKWRKYMTGNNWIIRGGTLVEAGQVRRGDLRITGGIIREEGIGLAGRPDHGELDATGRFVFPGLVNTHTHLFQVLLKGLGKDLVLGDWLNAAVRPFIHRMEPEDFYWAALLGLMDMIESGVTTALDYMYANGHPESMGQVIRAYRDLGLMPLVARGWSEKRVDFTTEKKTWEETGAVLKVVEDLERNYPDARIPLAPTALWAMEDSGIRQLEEFVRGTDRLVTMHINETLHDNRDSQERLGANVVPYLDSRGLLGPGFLGVHGVWLDRQDMDTLAARGAGLSYNPVSNMLLGSGVAPVGELLSRGVPVSLGTDGAASNDTQNMLEVLKMGSLLQKVAARDPRQGSAPALLEMATRLGARSLGLSERTGSLKEGFSADLFLFNPRTTGTTPAGDPVSSLIYASGKDNIEEVLVSGRIIKTKGGDLPIGKEQVMLKVWEISRRLVL